MMNATSAKSAAETAIKISKFTTFGILLFCIFPATPPNQREAHHATIPYIRSDGPAHRAAAVPSLRITDVSGDD
jgi:hypothetical protein